MSLARNMLLGLSTWIDDVAEGLARAAEVFSFGRRLRLVEESNGDFLLCRMRKGSTGASIGAPQRIDDGGLLSPLPSNVKAALARSHVEIVLKPSRFIFRSLELPRQASAFLDGVVRAQIDRLAPWRPSDAAFGWSAPTPAGDRITVTVAVTARALIQPIVDALAATRPASICVVTSGEGENAALSPIAVLTQNSGGALRGRGTRRALIGALVVAGLAFAASLGAAVLVGGDLEARRVEAERQVAMRRAELLSGRGSLADDMLAALDARKRETASGVIVLENLSQILPDDTYLNELRIEDGKVQITGLTRDAPALIRLIEQTRHFARATFFAPTTRAPSDSGESFHIEARVEPQFRVSN